MPKVTGPLFSVEAHKQLAKALTYQRRPRGASVYGYKTPKVPLTYLQVQQRGLIAAATAYWQSLSDAAKAEWEAKARGQGQSGYSYMIKQYVGLNFDRPLWLPLNEGTGIVTADRSGHGNNATITGATWTQLPSGKRALLFDGGDDVAEVSDAPSLDIIGELTLKVWVKLSYIHPANEGTFLSKRKRSVGSNWNYQLIIGPDLKFRFGGTGWNVYSAVDNKTIDRFYCVVGTFKRPDVLIFENGRLDNLATWDVAPVTNDHSLYLGAEDNGN